MKIPPRSLVLLLAVVAISLPLFAQSTTGTLIGTVTSDNHPLPGVTITISSPSMQGTRTSVTGDAGGYSFPSLPPGTYNVTYELTGMQSVKKRVTISVAQTSHADASLAVASVSEAITVTASAAPAVETTEVATNFAMQTINELPLGRTVDDQVLIAPGVTEAGPNDQITISGANSFDNLFLVNGVVVNENLRGQPNPLYIEDAVQETTILSGGISAEFGRFTGGVVSTITKSGGNDFSGSLRDSLANPEWTKKTPYAGQATPLDQINPTYEGTLGGRILRDKLWFFGAGRVQSRDENRQTTQTNIPYAFGSDDHRYEAKLTGQITPKHSVVASHISSREKRTNYVTSGRVVDLRSLSNYDRPKSLLALTYNGIVTNNLLLEGHYSRMNDKFMFGAENRDLIDGTLLLDASTGNRMWSPTFCGSPCPWKERDNNSWLAKSSYFLSTRATGNHSMVGGIEEFHQLRNENNYQSGSDFRIHGTIILDGTNTYFGVNPSNAQIEYDPVPALSKTSDFAVRSFFVNDKWELNDRWNFNLGARYDKAFGTDQAGHKTVDDTAVSPRFAVAFDPNGQGKHRFGATYGRYVSKVDQGPADNTATAGRYASYYWDYAGPIINPAGTPISQLVPVAEVIKRVFDWFNSVGGKSNSSFLTDVNIPGTTTRFDKSLQAPYMDELTAGYSLAFGNRGFIRGDIVSRKWAKFYVVRRTLATGKAVDPNGNTFDQGVIENADDTLKRNYRALQMQGNARLWKTLTLGGNYTYSKLRGNTEGETTNATSLSDLKNYPEYTDFEQNRAMGYLGPDMRHRANIWLQYDLNTPIGRLNLSALERYHSALSYSAVATIDVRKGAANGPANGVVNPGYQVPPSTVTYFFSDRGAFRLDDIKSTDLGVNFYIPGFRGTQFFVEADLINAFNAQGLEDPDGIDKTVLNRRSTACLQTGTTTRCLAFNPFTDTPKLGTNYQFGPNFGKPINETAYQQPRTYRFSVGMRF